MRDYSPGAILVTGGAGFIGANFVHFILANAPKARVVNLDLLTYAGRRENLKGLSDPGRHHFVKGDVADRDLVELLLREHAIDTVVHFAAESHVDRSIHGPEAFVHANVTGTFTLLEACRRFWLEEKAWDESRCLFHHVSTDEVYGMLGPEDPPFSETTPYAPNSPYAASKAASDHFVRAYRHTYGLATTTSNCSNNFGPFQHGEKLIPTIIRSCLNETPIPVYGDGSNVRDWLFVEDHCRGILAVMRRGRLGETYNIGGDNEWPNLKIVKKICAIMDGKRPRREPHEALIAFVPDRPGHDWRYAIDAQKIKNEVEWRSRESFDSGLEKSVVWYLDDPERLRVD